MPRKGKGLDSDNFNTIIGGTTHGGAMVSGDISTSAGDFVGRDKFVSTPFMAADLMGFDNSQSLEDSYGFSDRYAVIQFYLNLARDFTSEISPSILHTFDLESMSMRVDELSKNPNLLTSNTIALISDLASSFADAFPLLIMSQEINNFSSFFKNAKAVEQSTISTLVEQNLPIYLESARQLIYKLDRFRETSVTYEVVMILSDSSNTSHKKSTQTNELAMKWSNIGRLIYRSIFLLLEELRTALLAPKQLFVRLTLDSDSLPSQGFAPNYLKDVVIPYLDSLTQLQHVIDEIQQRTLTDVRILGIRYGSVTVDITAGIRETVELVMDTIVPWRRKNKRRLSDLEISEKEIELKKKRSEIDIAKSTLKLETQQAEIETKNAEAERTKLLAEARKIEAETRQQEIANQKTQLELLQLTLEMINKTAPNLPEEKRLYYAMKLVDPTRLIATSPLELVNVQVMGDGKEPQKDSTEHGDHPDQPTNTPDAKE